MRKFFHFGKDSEHAIVIEIDPKPDFDFGIKLNFSADDDITLELSFIWSLWLSFDSWKYFNKPYNKVFPKVAGFLSKITGAKFDEYGDYSTGFKLYKLDDEFIFTFQVLNDEMDSSNGLIDIYVILNDLLFGNRTHSSTDIKNGHAELVMPEKKYEVRYLIFESQWKRKRWPFPKKVKRIQFAVNGGVPIPGKGENSWDLDDDAIYTSTEPLNDRSIETVMEDFAKEIIEIREKRACKNWIPAKGWAL